MGSLEEPILAEGHTTLNDTCLSGVLFAARELTAEPTAANEAAFKMAETASHEEIMRSLQERTDGEGGPDRYMDQVRNLYSKEVADDTNLTLEFLGGLKSFVRDFEQKNSLN